MRLYSTIAVLFLLSAPAAWAQDSAQTKEKLYNFDEMLIDGAYRDPQGMFETSRQDSSFKRILQLRRSFIEEIKSDAKEKVVRQ